VGSPTVPKRENKMIAMRFFTVRDPYHSNEITGPDTAGDVRGTMRPGNF